MRSNVWCAWWRKQFVDDEYLYHYTSFEAALRILYSDRFRFSSLSRTNDTTEQKLRICYDFQMNEDEERDSIEFEKYWLSWTRGSKLLCFSQDTIKPPSFDSSSFSDITDVSGRGFALPRMWAQYASNNSGVCLIVKKKPFVEKVHEIYPEAICKSVSYFDWTESFKITKQLFNRLMCIIRHNPKTGYAATFLKENAEFADYSFFSKLKDWAGEKEYRILLPDYDNQCFYLEGVQSYLAGIALGEQMDDVEISALRAIVPPTIPIRKIVFELKRCLVININDINPFP